MKYLCQIYKSSKKEEMYLYVLKERGLEDVPEPLMASFGEPVDVSYRRDDCGDLTASFMGTPHFHQLHFR